MTNFCPLIRQNNEILVLKNSPYYTDDIKLNTSLSQMRDDLVLLVFNKYNLYLLGINGHYQFFAFQFMLILFLTSIQSNNLSAKARIDIWKTDYFSMSHFKCYSQNRQSDKINNKNIVNFIDNNNYHLIISNLFVYSFAFKYFGDEISAFSLSFILSS